MWGLGFGAWGSGSRARGQGVGLGVQGRALGSSAQDSGLLSLAGLGVGPVLAWKRCAKMCGLFLTPSLSQQLNANLEVKTSTTEHMFVSVTHSQTNIKEESSQH